MSCTPRNTLTLVVELPPAALHQNARVHHFKLASAKKKAKGEAWLNCKAEMGCGAPWRWPKARLRIGLFFPDKRRRDVLNYMAALKYAIDGCVEAGLLVDDDWEHLEIGAPMVGIDAETPRAMLHFERMDQ